MLHYIVSIVFIYFDLIGFSESSALFMIIKGDIQEIGDSTLEFELRFARPPYRHIHLENRFNCSRRKHKFQVFYMSVEKSTMDSGENRTINFPEHRFL